MRCQGFQGRTRSEVALVYAPTGFMESRGTSWFQGGFKDISDPDVERKLFDSTVSNANPVKPVVCLRPEDTGDSSDNQQFLQL